MTQPIAVGVDTTHAGLTGKILADHNYSFVCRYYQDGGSNPSKSLTPLEVIEKSANNIRIVSNYETDGRPINTVAEGESHAKLFLQQHARVGGPDWAPCYFSIDYDTPIASKDLYLKGLCNVLGVERVGIYAEDGMIVHAKQAGLITYGWRSMSSSFPGNPSTTDCNLVQLYPGGSVAGYSVDFDHAITPLYGGWLLGEEKPVILQQSDANLVADATLNRDNHIQNMETPGDFVSLGTWSGQVNAALSKLQTSVETLENTGPTAVTLAPESVTAVATELAKQLRGTL